MRTVIIPAAIVALVLVSALGVTAQNDEKNQQKLHESKITNSPLEPSIEKTQVNARTVSTKSVLAELKQTSIDEKVSILFSEADKNIDNQLSEQEFIDYQTQKAQAAFAVMSGSDGFVTRDEMSAYYAQKSSRDVKSPGSGSD